MTRIAIVTFDGFNEIDSFVALNMLNRVERIGWRAALAGPSHSAVSMNGVRVDIAYDLEWACDADAVLFGSGRRSAQFADDPSITGRLRLDPVRQLIGSQCSGALMLASLGLLEPPQACTDRRTAPLLEERGIQVLDQAFRAVGKVATAGGCLSAHYLATWVIGRLAGRAAAEDALRYVVPVGEESQYIERAIAVASADQN
jgi:transcriptional regulator GlxA family with amidase domain